MLFSIPLGTNTLTLSASFLLALRGTGGLGAVGNKDGSISESIVELISSNFTLPSSPSPSITSTTSSPSTSTSSSIFFCYF